MNKKEIKELNKIDVLLTPFECEDYDSVIDSFYQTLMRTMEKRI